MTMWRVSLNTVTVEVEVEADSELEAHVAGAVAIAEALAHDAATSNITVERLDHGK